MKKKVILINRSLNLYFRHNRFKVYLSFIKNKNNKYIKNFIIYISFLQIQHKYKYVDQCYNLGLSWEKFYLTFFFKVGNYHFNYIKNFFDTWIPKKFLNIIIKLGIHNNLGLFYNLNYKKNLYTKNNPIVYFRNYLLKYKKSCKIFLKKKKRNLRLQHFFTSLLIRNIFYNKKNKRKKTFKYFLSRSNKNYFYSFFNNTLKYKFYKKNFKYLNNLFIYKKNLKFANNLNYNKIYLQNNIDQFSTNICNNYISNKKIISKRLLEKKNFYLLRNKNKKNSYLFKNKRNPYFWKNKNKKNSYFFYNKLYNLYFYWYIYLNDNYLYFFNKTFIGLWLTFFFFSNKLGFSYLELYTKKVTPFFNKTFNIFSDYTIFKWLILKKDLYYNTNQWFIKKLSKNWFFLSRTVFIFRDYFNIFDNQRRSYKLWFVKKSKKTPLLLPFNVFRNAKFYIKKGKRFKLPKKKTRFFAIYI